MFLSYRAEDDFVGMDMARKFLQMGYTRARRYANHKSGRKYAPAVESYCLMTKTRKKHNQLRCFIRNRRRPETIRSIYN